MPVGDHDDVEPCGVVMALRAITEDVQRFMTGFDPALVPARDAAAMVPLFVHLENLGAAGKALAAERVAGTGLWQTLGWPSAAAWLASLDGTAVGEAVAVLQTVEAMGGLDATTDTFKAGKLSRRQARAVATAAEADPAKENELLTRAAVEPVTGLEKTARHIRLAASPETVEQRHARAQQNRRVSTWTDDDGGHGRWDLPLTDHARLAAALDAQKQHIFRAARSEGRREPDHAYLADALLALVIGPTASDGASTHDRDSNETPDPAPSASPSQPTRRSASDVKVIVRVDDAALQRGHALDGERCEIAGIGPVPVSIVRDWVAGDAFKAAIVADGVDIRSVVHLGRSPITLQRTALDWLSVTCTVAGCTSTARLEIDHAHDWATTLHTVLDHLDRLCGHHHDLKTHAGWTLGPRQPDGTRHLTPPGTTSSASSGATDPGGTPEAPPPHPPDAPSHHDADPSRAHRPPPGDPAEPRVGFRPSGPPGPAHGRHRDRHGLDPGDEADRDGPRPLGLFDTS